MINVVIYEFNVPSGTAIIVKKLKITFDPTTGKYSHWLFIDELTDPNKKWVKIGKADFRSELRVYQKYIEDSYGFINKKESPFQQLSFIEDGVL